MIISLRINFKESVKGLIGFIVPLLSVFAWRATYESFKQAEKCLDIGKA